MTRCARSKYSPDRRVRSTSRAFSRSVRVETLGKAGAVTVMAGDCTWWRGGLSSAECRALHLSTRRLRQFVREVDDARVLVRRGLALDVVLELGGQRLGGRDAVAQHDDRAHDAAALLVGRGDDRRLRHRGVGNQRGLDLERADAVAGGDDHVVEAALEVEVAVVVTADAVAGVPTAVRGWLAAEVADEERRHGGRVGD